MTPTVPYPQTCLLNQFSREYQKLSLRHPYEHVSSFLSTLHWLPITTTPPRRKITHSLLMAPDSWGLADLISPQSLRTWGSRVFAVLSDPWTFAHAIAFLAHSSLAFLLLPISSHLLQPAARCPSSLHLNLTGPGKPSCPFHRSGSAAPALWPSVKAPASLVLVNHHPVQSQAPQGWGPSQNYSSLNP